MPDRPDDFDHRSLEHPPQPHGHTGAAARGNIATGKGTSGAVYQAQQAQLPER